MIVPVLLPSQDRSVSWYAEEPLAFPFSLLPLVLSLSISEKSLAQFSLHLPLGCLYSLKRSSWAFSPLVQKAAVLSAFPHVWDAVPSPVFLFLVLGCLELDMALQAWLCQYWAETKDLLSLGLLWMWGHFYFSREPHPLFLASGL